MTESMNVYSIQCGVEGTQLGLSSVISLYHAACITSKVNVAACGMMRHICNGFCYSHELG